MGYSVKKSVLKNGIASSIQKAIRIFEQLILIPFFISAWGAEYYGEWLTLTIIPTVLALSDFGFGSAAANALVVKYASGDKQGASNIAKNGLYILSAVIVFGILLSVITLFVLNAFGVFDKSLITKTEAMHAVLVLMISRIINFYQQLYEAFYRAARRAALSINLVSIYSFVNIIASLTVLSYKGSVVAFAYASLIVSLLFNPVYAYFGRRSLGLYKTHIGAIDKAEIRIILKNGMGYLLSPMWQAFYFQGITFAVRIVLGPVAVAIFNTVRTVSRTANQAFNFVISAIYPDFQYELNAGNRDKAKKLFVMLLLINIIIALFSVLFLFFFGSKLYELWTHKSLNPPALMWNIFLVGIFFNSLWWTSMFIFQAANKPYDYTSACVICSFISVGLSYYFSTIWGISGAAIAHVSLDVLLTFYMLPKGVKFLDLTFKEFMDYTNGLLIQIKGKIFKNQT